MSLRRQKPKDSLDLLLDTMCNTFGGIILIAILVALLAGNRLQLASPAASGDAARLRAQATEELSRLQKVAAALHQRILDEGLQRKVELLRKTEELQAQLASIKQGLQVEEAALHQLETLDPQEQKAELELQLEQLQEQIKVALKTGNDLENDMAARRATLMRLQQQVRSTIETSVLRLRYPREHETSKDRLYVLIKFGHLYPTQYPSGGRNDQTIDWAEVGDDSIAKPRLSMGMNPQRDSTQTEAFFAGINPQTQYIAFIVFQDSFAEFRLAQRYCAGHNLEYGWSAKLQSSDVIFSSRGRNPPPQ